MTIYWILLILAIILLLMRNKDIYKNKFQEQFILTLFIIVLGIIYIFRSYTVGTDYKLYRFFFLTTTNNYIENGYAVLNHIAQYFNNFLIIAIFTYIISFLGFFLLGSKALHINKFSLLSFYVITGFYANSFNLVREFIAVGFVCFGTYFLLSFNRHVLLKYLLFILFIFIAIKFHNTAIFCLMFIFLSKIKFGPNAVLIGGILTTILAFTNIVRNLCNKLLFIFPSYGLKYQGDSNAINSLGSVSIIKFLPIISLFIFLYIFMLKAHIPDTKTFRFILSGFFIYLLMFSADGNDIISRLQTYTLIFPIFFSCLFMNHNILKKNTSIIQALFVILLILIYSIQLIHGDQGIVPYSFI